MSSNTKFPTDGSQTEATPVTPPRLCQPQGAGGIYELIHRQTGRAYIGVTQRSLSARITAHSEGAPAREFYVMIAGATRGAGGSALGRHLASATKNEAVRQLAGRGLIATPDRRPGGGAHSAWGARPHLNSAVSRPRRPARRPGFNPAERADYWNCFELEFGLQDRPFAAVEHVKCGRAHEHRVYLRVRPDGTAIRLDHDHARREKIGRMFEFTRGDRLVPGAHSRAVIAALRSEGRTDVADAMRAAGLDVIARPRAALTPAERHQQERTKVLKADVGAAALAAWQASDSGPAFRAALAEHGLRLARGDSTPQILDATGGAHDLRRALANAAKAAGADSVLAKDVRKRLAGLELLSVADVRRSKLPAPANTAVRQPSQDPMGTSPAAVDLPSQAQEIMSPAAPAVLCGSAREAAEAGEAEMKGPPPFPAVYAILRTASWTETRTALPRRLIAPD